MGGCPFLYAPWLRLSSSPFLLPSWQIFSPSGQIFGKKGQKLIFICSILSYPRIFGDNKRQKPNIFLKCGCKVGAGLGLLGCFHRVHLVQACRLSRDSGPEGSCPLSSGRVFPAFWSLCCFAFGALVANMALFRVLRGFLARFGGFVWVCIAWVLCVACEAFARVNS